MSNVELNTIENVNVEAKNNVIDCTSLKNSKQFDSNAISELFGPSIDSDFSHNYPNKKFDNDDLESHIQSTSDFLTAQQNTKQKIQFSEKSQKIIDDANQLLKSIEERHQFKTYKNKSDESITYAPPAILHDYAQEST